MLIFSLFFPFFFGFIFVFLLTAKKVPLCPEITCPEPSFEECYCPDCVCEDCNVTSSAPVDPLYPEVSADYGDNCAENISTLEPPVHAYAGSEGIALISYSMRFML